MKPLLLLAAILLRLVCIAQQPTVKLIASSSTSWSGGIAGRYGTSYNFTVAFPGYGHDIPEPDTFWIGQKSIPVMLKNKTGQNYNTIRAQKGNTATYTFIGGTDNYDEDAPNGISVTKSNGTARLRAPIKYKGVALITYKYKGRVLYFTIDKIMNKNPPVNYP